MRHLRILACTVLATVAATAPSIGEESERYQLERSGDGYVRLDTSTGRMSLCQERDGQLVCRMAVEERAAYDRDFDAMHDRIEALEGRVAALEDRPAIGLPTEQEFERTLSYMERFFRRFMDIVEDPEPPADRT